MCLRRAATWDCLKHGLKTWKLCPGPEFLYFLHVLMYLGINERPIEWLIQPFPQKRSCCLNAASHKNEWIWCYIKIICAVVASALHHKCILSAVRARSNPLSPAEVKADFLPQVTTPCLALQTWSAVLWRWNRLQTIAIIRMKYLVFFHSREFSKPLLPVGRAGVLLAEILHLLCKQMVSVRV